jgi:hypothetical protein
MRPSPKFAVAVELQVQRQLERAHVERNARGRACVGGGLCIGVEVKVILTPPCIYCIDNP